MRQLLIKAFKDAVGQIKKGLRTTPLESWNESVFRFVYSRAVAKQEGTVRQIPECSRIDLVLHRRSERAFIEFKFYVHRVRYDPYCGNDVGWKGAAGRKNYREFKKCVQRIRRRSPRSKVLKLVALFYSDPLDTKRKKFDDDYGGESGVEDKLKLSELESYQFRYIQHNGSEEECNAKLYKVLT